MNNIAFYRERVEHFKKQIALARDVMQSHESGLMKLSDMDSSGRVTDLTKELIKDEKGVIERLEKVIAAYQKLIDDARGS